MYALLIEYTSSQTCEFRIGSVSYLSGNLQTVGESITAGYKMAINDYLQSSLHSMNYFTSNIFKLDPNCTLSMDLRDIQTDIKVGIVEIFSLSSTYDQCAITNDEHNQNNNNLHCTINMPFVTGPATSGDCLTTNPLIEAFNLLQFSPSATSTFLSNYNSFYRPIPSDDIQARALIDLCDYFNWDALGILYINTDYGNSLQRALTSYANNKNIKVASFSYISGDNITLTNAIETMYESDLFIFILIVYDGDVDLLSYLLLNKQMTGYPYYFIGVDSWLYNTQFTWNKYLNIYGGMIGTCPWSPSINDPLYELYKYPLNVSLQMFEIFYNKWNVLQTIDKRYDITYNIASPGIFTIYAYDVMLTIIKIIDEYIYKYNIKNMTQFWNRMYDKNNIIKEFKQILSEIWFIGLSGNVSYGGSGDRYAGLFSYCNVNPDTGEIKQIGFNFNDEIILNNESIIWPLHYSNNKPETYYISYDNGISTKKGSIIPILIWFFIFLSMLLTVIYVFLLYFYRKRKIIKASQWKLSMLMGIGCIICYISLILFGIDESFPVSNKPNYKWNILCNFRLLLLNASFSLIFGPLFTKIYRINRIFSTAMVELKRYVLSDSKLFFYNTLFVTIDSILCFILIIILPFDREYMEGNMINYAITKWGSCTATHHYGFIYFIILGVPKVLFALYCIILSVSVYSTVSMMKFNEGLQVLICMVISVLLIFITVIVLSIISINSATSSIFYYAFLCFISLMVCNFCCAVMMLPRLFAIWKGHDNEQYVKNNEVNAIKKYLKTLRSNINKQSNSDKSDKNIKYSINVSTATNENNYNRLSSPSPRSELFNQTDLGTSTPQLTSQNTVSENNQMDKDKQQSEKIETIQTSGHIKSITVIQHEINESTNENDNVEESEEQSEDLLMAPEDAEVIVYNNNPRLSTRL